MRENERLACLAMLEEIANGPVGVVQIESLGGDWAPVERWRLHGADAVGSSVVIKTRRHDEGGWGGNPRNLVAEHEALAAVQQSGLRLAPGPIAWNEANGILIMQDLAPAQPIERLLYGNDPTAAETALVALASTTGTVQALTNLMGGERWNPHTALDRFPRRWTGIVEAARRLRFPDPSPAAADAASVGTALGDPAWQTFTHTDLAPNNAVIADGVVHLVDFEGAGVRHCMTDGAMFSLSFPQYGLWATMPETVTGKMERAYRSSLAAGLSEANDDVAYDHALATGCAAWTLIRLDRLDKLADPDQDSALALRRRTQIVHTVEACMRVLANTCAYPALHEWLGEMVVEMQRRWPEARIQPRQFPAFN